MKKLIVVAFAAGRCGSSMIMGLLHRAGVNMGDKWDNRPANVENPGGFYETQAIEKFIYGPLIEQMRPFVKMPSFEKLRTYNKKFKPDLEKIFETAYHGVFPLAIKDMHLGMLPMFENDPEYDVRVIWANRPLHDQALSVQKVWNKPGYPAARFEPWLSEMNKWMAAFRQEFKFKSLDITFNEMLKTPVEIAKQICEFCEIQLPTPESIKAWIRPEWSRSINGSSRK